MEMLSTGTNFLLILFGFGALIFVHELGHFLAARWAGIRVEGFSIGMGPPLVSWRRGIGCRSGSTDPATRAKFGRNAISMSDEELATAGIGETEYTLRLLPIGGFVRMLGQEDGNPGAISSAPRSYQTAPIGKRMVVVGAGVVMNLILAVLLFLIAFAVGVRFPAPIIGGTEPGSPAGNALATNADAAGLTGAAQRLQPGDTIVAIDGDPVATYADVMQRAAMNRPGNAMHISVLRRGIDTTLEFEIAPALVPQIGLYQLGERPALSATITSVASSRDSIEQQLRATGLNGLEPGATLLAINGRSVATFEEFEDVITKGDGASFETTWSVPSRPTPLSLTMRPDARLDLIVSSVRGEETALHSLFGITPLVRVDTVMKDSPNHGTLLAGDVILRAGTCDGPNFFDLRRIAKDAAGNDLALLVLRDGQEVALETKVLANGTLGFLRGAALDIPVIAQPVNEALGPRPSTTAKNGDISTSGESAAERPTLPLPVQGLDLFARSTIVSAGGTPVEDWTTFREALRAATAKAAAAKTGATVELVLALPLADAPRETKSLTLAAADVERLHALTWSSPISPMIFDPKFVTLKASGPIDAVRMGLAETKKMILQVYLTIDRVAHGSIGIKNLNGPVGIFHIGVKVADQGFMWLLFFIAMLSVNLAVINFLPIPIVDGGLFLFLVYEKIMGRPPSIPFQNAATAVGLLLIGSIFLITFYNDVARLVQ